MEKLFLPTLAKALNAYLQMDPESTSRLHKLQDKTVAIQFLPLPFTFQCVFHSDHISLHHNDSLICDTTIRGTPLQMVGMMLAGENRHTFFADDIQIEGNAELGQQVVELFDELEIDWEEHVSNIVGDIPAHHAGRVLRSVKDWLQKTEQSFSQNINEFIHEEIDWFPTPEAIQDYFADIDALRMDADRLEARITHLKRFLKDSEDTQ